MKVYHGDEDNRTLIGECRTQKEAFELIKKDVRERNRFNSCYYRMWNIQGGMKVDYGSHTHFYYIYWE